MPRAKPAPSSGGFGCADAGPPLAWLGCTFAATLRAAREKGLPNGVSVRQPPNMVSGRRAPARETMRPLQPLNARVDWRRIPPAHIRRY